MRIPTRVSETAASQTSLQVFITMQTITLEEFLPSLGIRDRDLKKAARRGFDTDGVFATVEFSIAYRLGHSLIPDQIGDFSLGNLFRSALFFLEPDVGGHPSGLKWKGNSDAMIDKMMLTIAERPAAELDGQMSDGLRNILFGPFPDAGGAEDLCSRNIYRGRDLHLPSYAGLARCYGIEPNQVVSYVGTQCCYAASVICMCKWGPGAGFQEIYT